MVISILDMLEKELRSTVTSPLFFSKLGVMKGRSLLKEEWMGSRDQVPMKACE
jgi:hypothetical protein